MSKMHQIVLTVSQKPTGVGIDLSTKGQSISTMDSDESSSDRGRKRNECFEYYRVLSLFEKYYNMWFVSKDEIGMVSSIPKR